MQRFHLIVIYSLIALLVGVVLFQFKLLQEAVDRSQVTVNTSDGQEIRIEIPQNRVKVFALPEKVSFAGEELPLKDPEVRERFEREIYVNAYWESNAILLMKRANKFLPTIEKILKEQGVPEDFKYLAMAESGLLNVVSPAGARGFWQFMDATAKEYNLEVSKDVDERYHLEKATVAACRYLKKAYASFGNWTSVAASYNMGISGLSKRKNEQRHNNYYDLWLNEETSRYIFRIVAFKELFENPERYGFELPKEELYELPTLRALQVQNSIPNLADWAMKHGSSFKDLKIHNPWLRSTQLNVSKGKTYTILLPV
ncbi:MAG: lytic transglycosylase domain-containing protein [Mongoliitalea sp.]